MKKSVYLFLSMLLLALTACVPSSETAEAPDIANPTAHSTDFVVTSDETPSTETPLQLTSTPEPTHGADLALSSDLVSRCKSGDDAIPNLHEGDLAVDFSLMDIDGNSFVLSELLKEKPVALIYGSFT